MSVIVCATNDMKDVRSCTVQGKHTDFCDGWAYRWEIDSSLSLQDPARRWKAVLVGPKVFDAKSRVWVTIPTDCTGCLPRKAEHGLLCWHCWEKTLDALKIAADMITHLRSVERAQQVDNAGVRSASGWVLPVPNTWRTSDELLMLLGHPAPGFPSDANVWEVEAITERYVDVIDPEHWVSRGTGADSAIRFFRLMQTAMAAHPMKEYEHRIKNVRCYKCGQRTLLWKPPLEHLDDIHVVCTNPRCDAEIDQTMYERLALIQDPKSRWARKKISGDDNVEPISEDEEEVVQS